MTASASATARVKQPPQDRKPPADVTPAFDLEAAAQAAADEASGKPVPFMLRGQRFTIPPPQDWPIEAQIALSQENLGDGLRLMIGDDEWDRFLSVRPTMSEVQALFQHVAKVSGVGDLGN